MMIDEDGKVLAAHDLTYRSCAAVVKLDSLIYEEVTRYIDTKGSLLPHITFFVVLPGLLVGQ